MTDPVKDPRKETVDPELTKAMAEFNLEPDSEDEIFLKRLIRSAEHGVLKIEQLSKGITDSVNLLNQRLGDIDRETSDINITAMKRDIERLQRKIAIARAVINKIQ